MKKKTSTGAKAGVVNYPCRVIFLYTFADLFCVKLSPALVEGNPAADAGEAVKRVYHFKQLFPELLTPFGLVAVEHFVLVVSDVNIDVRKSARVNKVQGLASAYHILPDYHAQSVAVVIPAVRLGFDD